MANFVHRVMILVLSLAVAGVLACDKKKSLRDTLFVAPELQPFISEFEIEAAKYGRDIHIKNLHAVLTDALADPATGECHASDGTPLVKISRSFWQTAGEAAKRLTVFHELGHCILKREHDDAVIFRNDAYIPRTLMISSQMDANVFLANYDYFMEELFSEQP